MTHPVGNMNICSKFHGNPSNTTYFTKNDPQGGATKSGGVIIVITIHCLGTMNCTDLCVNPSSGWGDILDIFYWIRRNFTCWWCWIKSHRVTKMYRKHPMESMNICTKFHANPIDFVFCFVLFISRLIDWSCHLLVVDWHRRRYFRFSPDAGGAG